jgi:uncharacterized integral membrane protein
MRGSRIVPICAPECAGRVATVNDAPQIERRSSWRPWALGIAVLLLVIVIFQNSQKVQVDFLFVHTTTPLIFALALAGILGALIGWLAPHVRRGRN